MTGARRRQGQVPAHVLYLLSVFALLAFALFPAVAGADSSNIQYSDAPPTATGGKEPTQHEAPAKSSKSQKGSNSSNTSGSKESHSPEGESPGSTQSKSDAAPAGSSNGGQNGGTGSQSNPGHGSQSHSRDGLQQQNQTAKPLAANEDSGGGSSPLVPILIAIGVLAAISIGAVMLRQRRQRGGASTGPISPKAS